MESDGNATVWDELLDPTGTHRLVLKFIEVEVPPPGKAYDFHSLVWEVKHGDHWSVRREITRVAFEMTAPRRRWISDIHSFDSTTGHAVVQIAQEQPEEPDGSMQVEYSWREWDLTNNREVRLLRVCKSPFESVDGKRLCS